MEPVSLHDHTRGGTATTTNNNNRYVMGSALSELPYAPIIPRACTDTVAASMRQSFLSVPAFANKAGFSNENGMHNNMTAAATTVHTHSDAVVEKLKCVTMNAQRLCEQWAQFMYMTNPWWNEDYHHEFMVWRFPMWLETVFPNMHAIETSTHYGGMGVAAAYLPGKKISSATRSTPPSKSLPGLRELADTSDLFFRTFLQREKSVFPLTSGVGIWNNDDVVDKIVHTTCDTGFRSRFSYAFATMTLRIWLSSSSPDKKEMPLLIQTERFDQTLLFMTKHRDDIDESMRETIQEAVSACAAYQKGINTIFAVLQSVVERAPSLGLRCVMFFHGVVALHNSLYCAFLRATESCSDPHTTVPADIIELLSFSLNVLYAWFLVSNVLCESVLCCCD